ncbi:MAG: universal stress protein [Phenylobacterium sp.]
MRPNRSAELPRTIHLHLTSVGAGSTPDVIQRAVAFAKAVGAGLDVTIAGVAFAQLRQRSRAEAIGLGVELLEADPSRRAADLASQVRSVCDSMSVAAQIETYWLEPESPDRYASAVARCSDFTMLGLAADDDCGRRSAEDLLTASGRPVLAWPAQRPSRVSLDRVFVAWDQSAAAARAVFGALPLLKRAGEVSVVAVETDEGPCVSNPAGRLCAYLAGHNIPARPRTLLAEGRGVGGVLADAALEWGATLVVMGAYGRPRARELLLGRTTRRMLSDPRLPLLLAH